jgi:hypothetical protein
VAEFVEEKPAKLTKKAATSPTESAAE